jgi:hypothetical protein
MRNNVRLLSTIQQSAVEAVVDLVAELVAPELDVPRWIKLGHQNRKPLRSKVLSHTAKIFDAEFLAESENSMNQDEIHDWPILTPSTCSPRQIGYWGVVVDGDGFVFD